MQSVWALFGREEGEEEESRKERERQRERVGRNGGRQGREHVCTPLAVSVSLGGPIREISEAYCSKALPD